MQYYMQNRCRAAAPCTRMTHDKGLLLVQTCASQTHCECMQNKACLRTCTAASLCNMSKCTWHTSQDRYRIDSNDCVQLRLLFQKPAA
eukprot:930008-Amphidinium_carterae.1